MKCTCGEILAKSFTIDFKITAVPTITIRVGTSDWPVTLGLAAVLGVIAFGSILLVVSAVANGPRDLVSPSFGHNFNVLADLTRLFNKIGI